MPATRGRQVGLSVAERESGGCHHPERRVRPVLVVVAAPVFDQDSRFGKAGEQLDGEQLVADA
jgi:hypothetical protein